MDKGGLVLSDVTSLIKKLAKTSEAGRVMLLGARLEKALEWLLQANMPELSKDLKEKAIHRLWSAE